MVKNNRRQFIRRSSQIAVGAGLLGISGSLASCRNRNSRSLADEDEDGAGDAPLFFDISLAQWSLHRALFDGKMDNLDFPGKARNEFDIAGVEWVNQFFKDKAEDQDYLNQMKQRCDDNNVRSLIIMIDLEGNLGDTDQAERVKAVENHYKWVDAAKYLGCHSIRVNAAGNGSADEVRDAAIDGLGRLSEYASSVNLNVLVENHGGYSSNGKWLASVMEGVGKSNCGTLPDFGNFCIERSQAGCAEMYDRYKGVTELMPYAKSVSAKTHNFDASGNETETDYLQMMKIVKDGGYTGFVGIEYEGPSTPEDDGIAATKALLQRVGKELS